MPKAAPRSQNKNSLRERDLLWLQNVKKWTGKSLSRIAIEAQLSDTTLSRFPRAGYTGTLAPETIEAVKRAHNVPGPEVVSEDLGRRMLRGEFREEASPFETEDKAVKAAVEALIGRRANFYPMILRTHALEAVGFRAGDVVIVEQHAQAKGGDAVCANVYASDGLNAETIWRVYDPPVLIAVPLDPTMRAKALIVDSDRVMIKGVIRGMVRPERPAA